MDEEWPKPERDENGRFLPGVASNPKGRPPIVREVRARCQEFMDGQGWQIAQDIAADAGEKTEARLTAIRLIAEYGYGKPSQKLEVDTGTKEIVVNLVPAGAQVPVTDA